MKETVKLQLLDQGIAKKFNGLFSNGTFFKYVHKNGQFIIQASEELFKIIKDESTGLEYLESSDSVIQTVDKQSGLNKSKNGVFRVIVKGGKNTPEVKTYKNKDEAKTIELKYDEKKDGSVIVVTEGQKVRIMPVTLATTMYPEREDEIYALVERVLGAAEAMKNRATNIEKERQHSQALVETLQVKETEHAQDRQNLIESMQLQENKHTAEMSEVIGKLEEVTKQLSEIEKDYNARIKALEQEKQRLSQALEEAKQEEDKAKAGRKKNREEILRLEAEAKKTGETLALTRRYWAQTSTEKAQLIKDYERLQASAMQTEIDHAYLEKRLAEAEAVIDLQQTQLIDVDNRVVAPLDDKKNRYRHQALRYKKALADKGIELAQGKEQIKVLEGRRKRLEYEVALLQEKQKRAQNLIVARNNTIKFLAERGDYLEDEVKRLKESIKTLEEERDGYLKKIADLSKRIEEMGQKVSKIKKVVAIVVPAFFVVGAVVTLASGWVARTIAQKRAFDAKSLNTQAEDNWRDMLQEKFGIEIIDIRGNDGQVEFWARKDGKLVYYAASNDKTQKWAAEQKDHLMVDHIVNAFKNGVSAVDEWANSFNSEAMTRLFNDIKSGDTKVEEMFVLAGGEDLRVIDGKYYNINGFENDQEFTGVEADKVAIALVGGNAVNIIDRGSYKQAYVTVARIPNDSNKEMTVEVRSVKYGTRENKTDEEIIADIFTLGEEHVEVTSYNTYNPVNESCFKFVAPSNILIENIEEYSGVEAKKIQAQLINEGVIDTTKKVTAKVAETEDGVEIYRVQEDGYKDSGRKSVVVITRNADGSVADVETFYELKLSDAEAQSILYNAVTGEVMGSYDHVYVNANSGRVQGGSSYGEVNVLTTTATENGSVVKTKRPIVYATSNSNLTTSDLIGVIVDTYNGNPVKVRGTIMPDFTHGVIIAGPGYVAKNGAGLGN